MASITITSLSNKGDGALKQHIDEAKKIKFKDRLIFKAAGYKQEVLNENPYSILLTVKNRLAQKPMFLSLIIDEIETALKDNGAEKDIDYQIINKAE